MQKRGRTKEGLVVLIMLSLIFIVLISVSVSAGWIDWIKTITGRATAGRTNVTLQISGTSPVNVSYIQNTTLALQSNQGLSPTEYGSKVFCVNVTVYDPNGRTDIDDTSVKIQLSNTRKNTTACRKLTAEYKATSQNYTCCVRLWYFDGAGAWTINVSARDLGNGATKQNISRKLTYKQLQAMQLARRLATGNRIQWNALTPGATNQTAATGNSTTLNNTGNYNSTAGKIYVNATNLYGTTGYFDVRNFTVGALTGSSAECSYKNVSNARLVNATNVNVTLANLTAGNLSAGGGKGQETLYWCIWKVPTTLGSGYYNTSYTKGYPWTIKIT